jgi:hypothetical protein
MDAMNDSFGSDRTLIFMIQFEEILNQVEGKKGVGTPRRYVTADSIYLQVKHARDTFWYPLSQ